MIRIHTKSNGKGFLGAQSVRNLPARLEISVPSLGQEASLEKEMATQPRILAWETAWTEEPGRLKSTGLQSLNTT